MITASNITKTFKQGARSVEAVRGVSLEIAEGERVYIHGPSGAGKSTLLAILGALNAPTEGVIEFKGQNIYKTNDRKRSQLRNTAFGFVFQFYHLLPELDVLDNIMLPAMIKGSPTGRGTALRRRALELVETVGMTGRIRHKVWQLSGGEAQRAAIARALINSPRVLFCDEPAGNLDSEMARQIFGLILKISRETGMSVIMVSHQTPEADFYDTEYVMRDGRVEKVSECQRVREKGTLHFNIY